MNIYCEVMLMQAFIEILFDENISDDIKTLRINGIKGLSSYLKYYENCGYIERLVNKIAEKKIKMIMQIKSKKEMEKMLKPSCPYFNGNKFIPNEYNTIEEELICWSETSLQAPLNEVGVERYKELFDIVFPEYKNQLKDM